MARLHLLELHEQPWCPGALRDGITDLLQAAINWFHAYDAIAPRLAAAVNRSGSRRVVDLASGGGGPWLGLRPQLARHGADVSVLFTDRYPNVTALRRATDMEPARAEFSAESVDATALPPGLTGFRTMFTAFHHFRPTDARAILGDAVRRGEGIGVFEITQRDPVALTFSLLALLAVLILVPFIRPFRWDRLLVTYLPPLLPLMAAFDGVVSCLRSYSPAELRDMVQDLPQYEWDIGRVRHRIFPMFVTYLIGTPRLAEARSAG